MSKFSVSLFLCVSLLFSWTLADYCQPQYVLADFPEQIKLDLFEIVTTGNLANYRKCADDVKIDSENVVLWYNNKKDHPDQPIILDQNNPNSIDTSKPLFVLIHGWLCNITSDLMPELKDAYFKKYKDDINVIRVEWNKYATDSYYNSYCYIPKVAEVVGKFLCSLDSNHEQTHIVGHSFGGQLSAFVAKEVQKQCKKTVGRLTALDPAGQWYHRVPEDQRLNKNDAKIVDVIHTNQRQAGFFGPCGTVDFYPNCGFHQPNSMIITNVTKIEELLPLSLDTILRSHILAVEYMVESILSDSFKGSKCVDCEVEQCKPVEGESHQVSMGEPCPENVQGDYVVYTNSKTPYGLNKNRK